MASDSSMQKASLIIVTGKPASGKTTLAHIISEEIKWPLISRDELKENFVQNNKEQSNNINQYIYEKFFQSINEKLSQHISIIAEAAFQHKLWQPQLISLSANAVIKIIICNTDYTIAVKRFNERILNNQLRKDVHEETAINATYDDSSLIKIYKAPQTEFPVLHVDTTYGYKPSLEKIIKFIKDS